MFYCLYFNYYYAAVSTAVRVSPTISKPAHDVALVQIHIAVILAAKADSCPEEAVLPPSEILPEASAPAPSFQLYGKLAP